MHPSPASTVVLVRERNSTGSVVVVETLLLLRNRTLAFDGGAWVFPGGRVDAADRPRDHALLAPHEIDFVAARNAAVRETREEAGLEIQAEELIHFAHWTTPPGLPRRFATWFFLCPLQRPCEICVDDEEIKDYQWVTAADALQRHEQGVIRLPFPTRHTLESIREFRSVAELCAEKAAADIHVFPENSEFYRPVGTIVCGS